MGPANLGGAFFFFFFFFPDTVPIKSIATKVTVLSHTILSGLNNKPLEFVKWVFHAAISPDSHVYISPLPPPASIP